MILDTALEKNTHNICFLQVYMPFLVIRFYRDGGHSLVCQNQFDYFILYSKFIAVYRVFIILVLPFESFYFFLLNI